MFRGGYGIYKWFWVILASPFTIGLVAILAVVAAVVIVPAAMIYERFTGIDILAESDSANETTA